MMCTCRVKLRCEGNSDVMVLREIMTQHRKSNDVAYVTYFS